MGAHSTPRATRPTGARIVTTTLAVAATSVLGAGTALAHDDAGHHGHSHSSSSGEHGAHAASGDPTDDLLREVGMTSWDPSWDSSWDSTGDDGGSDDTGDGSGYVTAPAAAPQVPPPAPARPTTSTQPIAAPASTTPASTVPAELPAPGETQTIPIRRNQ